MDERGRDEEDDLDSDNRNYAQLQNALPVFCVSSRAFQKLRGRLRKDKLQRFTGFRTVEDTGIPQLQDHVLRLTEDSRRAACVGFLNALELQLDSMKLWTSNPRTLKQKERQENENILIEELKELQAVCIIVCLQKHIAPPLTRTPTEIRGRHRPVHGQH